MVRSHQDHCTKMTSLTLRFTKGPCGNCRYCVHLVGAELAKGYEHYLPLPSSQSGLDGYQCAIHAYQHTLTFSNYQRRLQEAILAIQAIKYPIFPQISGTGSGDLRVWSSQPNPR
jgi:hypothetical protein